MVFFKCRSHVILLLEGGWFLTSIAKYFQLAWHVRPVKFIYTKNIDLALCENVGLKLLKLSAMNPLIHHFVLTTALPPSEPDDQLWRIMLLQWIYFNFSEILQHCALQQYSLVLFLISNYDLENGCSAMKTHPIISDSQKGFWMW